VKTIHNFYDDTTGNHFVVIALPNGDIFTALVLAKTGKCGKSQGPAGCYFKTGLPTMVPHIPALVLEAHAEDEALKDRDARAERLRVLLQVTRL
jgi:hypothetical protein